MKITATVDIAAVARAISESLANVLHAHGYVIGRKLSEAPSDGWTLGEALTAALVDEIGRNAAQACLAPGVIDEIDEIEERTPIFERV